MSDRRVRQLATAAVLLVAAIAAVVSYIHVESLAATHGQDWLAARLEPLSVDGTVAAAGLQMLAAARAGAGGHWLHRVMLWSGVAATLAANVAYGWAGGVISAVVSGWPAYAFIGSAEMTMVSVRRGASAPAAPAAAAAATGAAAAAVTVRRPRPAGPVRPGRAVGGQDGRSAKDIEQVVAAAVAAMAGAPRADVVKRVAAEAGVSPRTARRHVPADMAAAGA